MARNAAWKRAIAEEVARTLVRAGIAGYGRVELRAVRVRKHGPS